MTNASTVKPETVTFHRNEVYQYHDLDRIVNEFEPFDYTNVIVKVVEASKVLVTRET